MSPMIEVSHVDVVLGGNPVLEDVSLTAQAGELIGLIGPNGAGKTTLLRVIAGLLEPQSGSVALEGEDVGHMSSRGLARKLALLPQDHVVNWAICVEDLVALGRLPYRGFGAAPAQSDRAAIADALETMDLAEISQRPVTELSGGERARTLIARALAQETRILLADEPAAGLDAVHQLDLFTHLQQLANQGCCVIVVMHDLTMASRFCDRLTVLDEGRIHATGPASKVLTSKVLKSVYGITAYRGKANGVPFVVPLESLADRGKRPN